MSGLTSEAGEMEQMPTITNNSPVTGFLTFLRNPQSAVRNAEQATLPVQPRPQVSAEALLCLPVYCDWRVQINAFLSKSCLGHGVSHSSQTVSRTESPSSKVPHWAPNSNRQLLLSHCPHPLSRCSIQCLETSLDSTTPYSQKPHADFDYGSALFIHATNATYCKPLSTPIWLPTPSSHVAWSTELQASGYPFYRHTHRCLELFSETHKQHPNNLSNYLKCFI